MVFVALEGFSGTGKTSIAKALEERGWLRLTESAHAVPKMVPVAERADTFADYSLLGATMVYCSVIAAMRKKRDIVSEGYLLSDLAYARIRYDLDKSLAFPAMLSVCKSILKEPALRPDLYILLEARPDTIESRQRRKNSREKNVTEYFRTRYYSALTEIHRRLGEDRVERIFTDSRVNETLGQVLRTLKERGLAV